MKLAFLYPGQGMQEPTLPDTLRKTGIEWRCLERLFGSELLRSVERGGAQLERTDVLQPVLVAICAAVTARLAAAGIQPRIVAGHSVGEIAAVAAAARIPPEDAIGLAATRGRLMAREAARCPGEMLALTKADAPTAREAIAAGEPHGVIALAAVNAPDQWVLSGEVAALEVVAARFPSRRLRVSGAWHSPLMAAAVPELRLECEAFARRPLATPLILNRTGDVLEQNDDLAEALAEQLVRPVQWVTSLQTLKAQGVTDIVTVGPGRVLRGLIRKNLGVQMGVHTTEDETDLGRTIQQLTGACDGQAIQT